MPAVFGFVFAVFAISWAWINYAWLASAYDNDDVFFRVATMVVMIGVILLALGIPATFDSIDAGGELENTTVVIGYVIMRVAVLALWLRAARHDPAHRRTAIRYAVLIAIAQAGWIALLIVDPPLEGAIVAWVLLVAFEMAGPIIAEHAGTGTPWHAHHIAERYGLLVIITLGEVVLGTILAISAVVEEQGWDLEAVLVTVGGTMLAFGLWWVYFIMPSGSVLARHRERGFVWGYGHIVIFASIAATGAGLHVAAYVIEGVAHIDDTAGAAHGRRPGGRVLGRALHALQPAAPGVRPLPHRPVRREPRPARRRGLGRRRGGEHGHGHRARGALAGGRHRRLRDGRAPPPGGRPPTLAGLIRAR